MKTFILKVLILFQVSSFAQNELFTRTFGGSGNDFAFSVQQTTDRGYIIAGQTESFGKGSSGNPDMWIIKLDKNGKTEWDKTFGGNNGDGCLSVSQTSDEGYIVSGVTSSFGKSYPSMWILKFNYKGDTVWTKMYEGSMVSAAYSIRPTSDGGFIVAGKGKENVLKLDKSGNKEWGRRYSWILCSVEQTNDGGYIAAGDSIYKQLNWDYLPSSSIIRLDRDGNKIWGNPLGDGFLGRVNSVKETNDAGFVFAGDSIALKTETDHSHYFMVCKLDRKGRKEWSYTGNEFSSAQWIGLTSDEGFIAAGNSLDDQNGLDLLLVKFDKFGKKSWSKTYGKSGTWEYASCVQQTSGGGYILSGQTESYGAGRYDGWILKTDDYGNITSTGIISNKGFNDFSLQQNYPNPVNRLTKIHFSLPGPGYVSLKVYNLSGKELETIAERSYPAGEFTEEWSPGNLADGIYFYRLKFGESVLTKIFVLKR